MSLFLRLTTARSRWQDGVFVFAACFTSPDPFVIQSAQSGYPPTPTPLHIPLIKHVWQLHCSLLLHLTLQFQYIQVVDDLIQCNSIQNSREYGIQCVCVSVCNCVCVCLCVCVSVSVCNCECVFPEDCSLDCGVVSGLIYQFSSGHTHSRSLLLRETYLSLFIMCTSLM